MTIHLHYPSLTPGHVYNREEVRPYVGDQQGTSDWDVAFSHFPRDLRTWDDDLSGWRDKEPYLVQYAVYPLEDFAEQITDLQQAFLECPDAKRREEEHSRIRRIVGLLRQGEVVYPVFLQRNDHSKRIIEGMHRAIALMQLRSPWLPAFLMGYRDWFEDGLPESDGSARGVRETE